MADDRIVEVYSAADMVEAHALCDLLQEEGIQARIVGGALGNAAGWIPAADAAPRIWVRETDQARAREIIDAYLSEPGVEMAESEDGDFQDETEEPAEEGDLGQQTAEPAEEGGQLPADEGRRGSVARGLAILGAACIVLGAIHTALRWTTIAEYSAETGGVLVDAMLDIAGGEPLGSRDLPIPRTPMFRVFYHLQYAYMVDGVEYRTEAEGQFSTDRVTIHYDPLHPARCRVGPIASPWLSLLIGGALGTALLLVAFRFR